MSQPPLYHESCLLLLHHFPDKNGEKWNPLKAEIMFYANPGLDKSFSLKTI